MPEPDLQQMSTEASVVSHAEDVRETYRKQGEQRMINLLLDNINKNPSVTTDYILYLLESLKK